MKKLFFNLSLLVFCLSANPSFSQKNTSKNASKKAEFEVACVGFYNLENLFDTLDTPDKNDSEFLPNGNYHWTADKYAQKQANMAKVVSQLGTELNPDGVGILGVAEIENRIVLEDLVKQPALAARNYQIVHHDSPDERGIDCAFLYQEKYFHLLGSKAFKVDLSDPRSGGFDKTRDVVYMAGILPGGDTLHLMVGHWPSRRGGESASAWARGAAAATCRSVVDSLQKINPMAKIFVMGDLNDDPTSPSLVEVLRGRENSQKMKKSDMYNPTIEPYKTGGGTLAYRDAWNLFDQMLTSKGLVSERVGGWQFYKFIVFRRDWLLATEGQYKGYPFRTFDGDLFINGYSDHLPVYSFLLKKK